MSVEQTKRAAQNKCLSPTVKGVWWTCYALLQEWFVFTCSHTGKGHCKSIPRYSNWSALSSNETSNLFQDTSPPSTGHRGTQAPNLKPVIYLWEILVQCVRQHFLPLSSKHWLKKYILGEMYSSSINWPRGRPTPYKSTLWIIYTIETVPWYSIWCHFICIVPSTFNIIKCVSDVQAYGDDGKEKLLEKKHDSSLLVHPVVHVMMCLLYL